MERVSDCSACKGDGRVWAPDRLDQYGDNTRDCGRCQGTGRIAISNPFSALAGRGCGTLADELASAVDRGREYALESWLLVASRIPHTKQLRAAFGPFVTAGGKVDREASALLAEFAREWVRYGEDCVRVGAAPRRKVTLSDIVREYKRAGGES